MNAATGGEGVLSPVHARRAAQSITGMPGAEHRRLQAVLQSAKSDTERHLILKAVAARKEALCGGSQARSGAAMQQIERFGKQIRGLDRATLIRRTSMLDLDQRKNTSRFDPASLGRLGKPLDRFDRDATNDGHFQRFTASCGAASVQVLRGEADPAYAYAARTAGFSNPAGDTAIAKEQRRWLAAAGGQPELKAAQHAYVRLRLRLNGLTSEKKITAGQRRDLDAVLRGSGRVTAAARRALSVLRKDQRGFPSASTLLSIRRYHADGPGHGTYPSDHRRVLQRHAGPVTGARYRLVGPLKKRGVARHLGKMAKALQDGHDLTIQFNDPDHWLSVTDVRGRKGRRQLRVHDTNTGRTRWVTAGHLVDGSMMRRHFGVTGNGHVSIVMLPR